MNDLDPTRFAGDLDERLARFIATSTPVNPVRAPRLAREVSALTHDSEIVKGPYLETLPDFEKGRSLEELVSAGRLSEQWGAFNDRQVYARPLHRHQDAALDRDDNYLVATGTGSGKTESFLYPLVDDILRDPDIEEPGVRAILVYLSHPGR